jgi:hypothetical protein
MAGLRFRAAVQGELERFMASERRALAKAGRAGVMAAAGVARKKLRDDLRGHRFRAGVGRMIRRATSASRGVEDTAVTSTVFSKAFTERSSQPADILSVLSDSGVARAHGKALAVPTRAAAARPSLRQWSLDQIDIVPARPGHVGRVLLKGTRIVLFWLASEVRIRQRLRLNAAVAAGEVAMDRVAVQRWEQYAERLEGAV